MERQNGAHGVGLTFEDMADLNGGLLPRLSVSSVMLIGLIAPLPLMWALTIPFGAILVLLGHPLIAIFAMVSSTIADGMAQRFYRRLKPRVDDDADRSLNQLAVALALRACVAISAPAMVVVLRPEAAELTFMGVTSCMLLCIATAQGLMCRRLFWASAGPVLAGIIVAILIAFPLREAAALLGATALLAWMMSMVGGGAGRIMGDWASMREKNNDLIARLRAEREEAEKAREEARLAGQAKANFLATMSHEIRTPMNGVLGMAQLLMRSAQDDDQRRQVATLIHSGEFLMSILNDILDISKIDAGRLDITTATEDPRALIDDLTQLWSPTADEKGLFLVSAVADSVPAFVEMDARRIRQILFNLIGNALKFTGEGGVTVSLEATPLDPGHVCLHIAVRDTGIGIDPAVLPALFERFIQADQSTSRQFGGAGLGLAISRQLTELMGGELWAEGEPEAGACFHLTLPLAIAAAPATSVAPTLAAVPDAAAMSVLIVDDNPVNLTVLRQILTALGHDVAQAGSGVEALEEAARRPFDLILLDIQMPGMSGVETLQALRKADGPNRDTRVLAVTADVLSRDRGGYLALGFSGHVAKPIQIGALIEEITIAADSANGARVAA